MPAAGIINGGFRISYERPLFLDEEVLCRMQLEDSHDKQGRRGLLVFGRTGESPDAERIFSMKGGTLEEVASGRGDWYPDSHPERSSYTLLRACKGGRMMVDFIKVPRKRSRVYGGRAMAADRIEVLDVKELACLARYFDEEVTSV